MKRIEAFLPPHRLASVVHRLHELPRFPGLTLLNAQGQGHGRGEGGHYAYDEGSLMYLDRKVLVIFCEDSEASAIAELIAAVSHTGNRGDGIVAISDVTKVVRVSTATEAAKLDPATGHESTRDDASTSSSEESGGES